MVIYYNHDVKTIGTYDRKGNLYIDRTAKRELSLRELRRVEAHERLEHRFRVKQGLNYGKAHAKAEKTSPFGFDLGLKLHSIANRVASLNSRNPPPSSVMNGATGVTEFGRYVRTPRKVVRPLTDIFGNTLGRVQTVVMYPHGRGVCSGMHKHKYTISDSVIKLRVGKFICPKCGGVIAKS